MIPREQAIFLFDSLYGSCRSLEPTEENRKMVTGLCNNMGWNQDIREYILRDLGEDYL